MPAYSIAAVHSEFSAAQSRVSSLLTTARTLQSPNGHHIHVRYLEELAGLGLLKLTLAWETFLEETFLRYLCGAKSSAGVAPNLVVARASTLGSAYQNELAGKLFLTWNPTGAMKRANRCFTAGAPYDPVISGAAGDLNDMIAIRNRIAHRSPYSVQEFQSVVRRHLTFVPKGMTPGRFLLTPLPQHGGVIALDRFTSILSASAHLISNHV